MNEKVTTEILCPDCNLKTTSIDGYIQPHKKCNASNKYIGPLSSRLSHTILEQRQTIDALTATLESLLDWADGYSSLPDNYTRRNARSTLDALEKARGESNA